MEIILGNKTFQFSKNCNKPSNVKTRLIEILESVILLCNLKDDLSEEEICDDIYDISIQINKKYVNKIYLRNKVISYLIFNDWLRNTGWFNTILKKVKDEDIKDIWWIFYKHYKKSNIN